ncbi:hypothetical protein, partial [Arthrobacter bambusae]|uniref:hypothetical protein n=1 Tax=Arthrobacter bambusae TaxID=1338426 RepID=UPI0027D833FE
MVEFLLDCCAPPCVVVWFSAGFRFCSRLLPLFPVGMVVFVFVFTSTESLILAQDERWRRA